MASRSIQAGFSGPVAELEEFTAVLDPSLLPDDASRMQLLGHVLLYSGSLDTDQLRVRLEALSGSLRSKRRARKLLSLIEPVPLAGSTLWMVPTIALIVFSFLEWAFKFCAACWAYVLWHQRFPPRDSASPQG